RSGTFISADLPAPLERRASERLAPPKASPPVVSSRARALERVRAFPGELEASPFNMGRTRVDARTVEAWRKLTSTAIRSLGPVLSDRDRLPWDGRRRGAPRGAQSASGVRDVLAPVPAGRGARDAATVGPAGLGPRDGRVGDRGRLRQRVSLFRTSPRVAPGA